MNNCTRRSLKIRSKGAALLLFVGLILPGSGWAAEITDSVVTIYASGKFGSAQGTGFVFGEGGRIVTAYHVVQSASRIEVRDSSFREFRNLIVEYIDPRRDVAVLSSPSAARTPSLK